MLLADLRGLGETTDPAAFNDPNYYNQEYHDALLALHLGRPLLAQRVLDVSTLLAFIRNESRLWQLPLLLRADGRAALVALHAAVLSPRVSKKPYTITHDVVPPPGSAPVWVPQIDQVQVSGGPASWLYYLENPPVSEPAPASRAHPRPVRPVTTASDWCCRLQKSSLPGHAPSPSRLGTESNGRVVSE